MLTRLAWLFIEWVIPGQARGRFNADGRRLSIIWFGRMEWQGPQFLAHLAGWMELVVFAISLCDVCPASFPTLLNYEDDRAKPGHAPRRRTTSGTLDPGWTGNRSRARFKENEASILMRHHWLRRVRGRANRFPDILLFPETLQPSNASFS